MRRLCLAAALGVFISSFSSSPLFAAGNVLVPDDDDNTGSTPSLGLTPAEPPADAKGKSTLPQKQEYSLPNGAPPAAAGSTRATSRQSTNRPAMMSPVPPAKMQALSAATAADIAKMFRDVQTQPTQVVKMAAPKALEMPKPDSADAQDAVSIEVEEKYTWGPNDVNAVTRLLGIPPEQVSSLCHVALSGVVNASQTSDSFMMNPDVAHTVIHIKGSPNAFTMYIQAHCDMVPLPEGSGIILQVGNKYSVPLQSIPCPAPPEDVQRVIFSYAGNGVGKCSYVRREEQQ